VTAPVAVPNGDLRLTIAGFALTGGLRRRRAVA
jgi:hypothetical protein